MTTIDDIPGAIAAIRTFERDLSADAPEHLRTALAANVVALSPVDAIVKTGEALYANLDVIDQGGKELCAALIGFATGMGWHGLAGGRGVGVARAAMREAGVELPGQQQAAQDDPEPKAEYRAPAVAGEPVEGPIMPLVPED